MIDLLLLGTGGMQPLPGRWLSSLLARVDGSLILFDCGEGTQIPWKQFHWGFRRLEVICLSHLHADHVAGLPGVLYSVANAGRTEPLTIYGPSDTARIVEGLRVIAPDLPFQVAVHELDDDERFPLPGGMTGWVRAGEHTMPSLAYRVDLPRDPRFDAAKAVANDVPRELWGPLQHGGRIERDGRVYSAADVLGAPRRGLAFAYITDTRPLPTFLPLVDRVDVLVCEATYADDAHQDKAERWGHMLYREAAELARAGDVGQLWLTHFSPRNTDPELELDRARRIFPRTIAGYSGLTARLSFSDRAEPEATVVVDRSTA